MIYIYSYEIWSSNGYFVGWVLGSSTKHPEKWRDLPIAILKGQSYNHTGPSELSDVYHTLDGIS